MDSKKLTASHSLEAGEAKSSQLPGQGDDEALGTGSDDAISVCCILGVEARRTSGVGVGMLTPYVSNPVSVSEPSTEDPGQAEHQAWEGRLLGASRGWQGAVSADRA